MSLSHMNKVMLIGNVGRDPESRSMSNGDQVVNLSLATSEKWKDKNSGEQREKTEWHRVVIFDQVLAKVAVDYIVKGSLVMVEGELQTQKWTDQSGVEKYTTEIVLQRFRGVLRLLGGNNRSGSSQGVVGTSGGSASDMDDEIPY